MCLQNSDEQTSFKTGLSFLHTHTQWIVAHLIDSSESLSHWRGCWAVADSCILCPSMFYLYYFVFMFVPACLCCVAFEAVKINSRHFQDTFVILHAAGWTNHSDASNEWCVSPKCSSVLFRSVCACAGDLFLMQGNECHLFTDSNWSSFVKRSHSCCFFLIPCSYNWKNLKVFCCCCCQIFILSCFAIKSSENSSVMHDVLPSIS